MTELEKRNIEKICFSVRELINKQKGNTFLFTTFPLGCCRDASYLLLKFLVEQGYKDILYCRRDFDEVFPSHVWLEYKETILDLTADQFGEEYPPVVVQSVFEDSLIYRKCLKREPDFSDLNVDYLKFLQDYNTIFKK